MLQSTTSLGSPRKSGSSLNSNSPSPAASTGWFTRARTIFPSLSTIFSGLGKLISSDVCKDLPYVRSSTESYIKVYRLLALDQNLSWNNPMKEASYVGPDLFEEIYTYLKFQFKEGYEIKDPIPMKRHETWNTTKYIIDMIRRVHHAMTTLLQNTPADQTPKFFSSSSVAFPQDVTTDDMAWRLATEFVHDRVRELAEKGKYVRYAPLDELCNTWTAYEEQRNVVEQTSKVPLDKKYLVDNNASVLGDWYRTWWGPDTCGQLPMNEPAGLTPEAYETLYAHVLAKSTTWKTALTGQSKDVDSLSKDLDLETRDYVQRQKERVRREEENQKNQKDQRNRKLQLAGSSPTPEIRRTLISGGTTPLERAMEGINNFVRWTLHAMETLRNDGRAVKDDEGEDIVFQDFVPFLYNSVNAHLQEREVRASLPQVSDICQQWNAKVERRSYVKRMFDKYVVKKFNNWQILTPAVARFNQAYDSVKKFLDYIEFAEKDNIEKVIQTCELVNLTISSSMSSFVSPVAGCVTLRGELTRTGNAQPVAEVLETVLEDFEKFKVKKANEVSEANKAQLIRLAQEYDAKTAELQKHMNKAQKDTVSLQKLIEKVKSVEGLTLDATRTLMVNLRTNTNDIYKEAVEQEARIKGLVDRGEVNNIAVYKSGHTLMKDLKILLADASEITKRMAWGQQWTSTSFEIADLDDVKKAIDLYKTTTANIQKEHKTISGAHKAEVDKYALLMNRMVEKADMVKNIRKAVDETSQQYINFLNAQEERAVQLGDNITKVKESIGSSFLRSKADECLKSVGRAVREAERLRKAVAEIKIAAPDDTNLEDMRGIVDKEMNSLEKFKERGDMKNLEDRITKIAEKKQDLEEEARKEFETAVNKYQNTLDRYDTLVQDSKATLEILNQKLTQQITDNLLNLVDEEEYNANWGKRVCPSIHSKDLPQAIKSRPHGFVYCTGGGVLGDLSAAYSLLTVKHDDPSSVTTTLQAQKLTGAIEQTIKRFSMIYPTAKARAGNLYRDIMDLETQSKEPLYVRVWESVNGDAAAKAVKQIQEITGEVNQEDIANARHEARAKAVKYGGKVIGVTLVVYWMYWLSKKALQYYRKVKDSRKARLLEKKLKVIKPRKVTVKFVGGGEKGRKGYSTEKELRRAKDVALKAMSIKVPVKFKFKDTNRPMLVGVVRLPEDMVLKKQREGLKGLAKEGLTSATVANKELRKTRKYLVMKVNGKPVKAWEKNIVLTFPV